MNRRTGTLVAAILGSGIVFLDSTVVNVALQRIGQDLPSSYFGVLEGQSYVYNAYLLSLSALLILAGALADAYGRRLLFVLGLVGFGAASILCGLAPNMETLIAFRIAQGAAGALLVPGSLALITHTFTGAERGRAFGLWAAASAATAILGPVVGGIFVDTISWRAVFFLNVPLIAIALWASWRYVEESKDPDAGRAFDWLGAVIVALAVGGLAFGAIYGQQHEWRDAVGPVALLIGAVSCVGFVVRMALARHPLVPLGLFRSRNFAVTNLSTFLIYGALYVVGYQQSIFSQGTLSYSAAAAGFIGVPGAFLLVILSSRVGSLGARLGPRRFMAVGPAVMAAGILWLTRMPADSAAWNLQPGDPASWVPPGGYLTDFLPATILFGLGLAVTVAPLTTALMASVPESRAGLGSAVNNAISRVGPQLAGALIFVAITGAFYADLTNRVPGIDTSSAQIRRDIPPLNRPAPSVSPTLVVAAGEASTDSFRLAMGLAAGLLLAGAVVNGIGIRDPDRVVRDAPSPTSASAGAAADS
ncbi:MAG TPA: MFS transporter [Candidatus Limnocylindrales bacterium]